MRGLLDATYCTLIHQGSENWERHANQHIFLYQLWIARALLNILLNCPNHTPKIPSMRLMSLDHEPKMKWCIMSLNHGLWWDNIAMGFGPWALASLWALLNFKVDFPKIHNNVDVVQVANEIKPYGVKNLSSTVFKQIKWDIGFV